MKKFAVALVILICCVSILCACSALRYDYAQFHFRFGEPDSEVYFLFYGKGFSLGKNNLFISDDYSDKEKQSILSFAEKAFKKLPSDVALNYVIGKGYANRVDGETGRIFLGTTDQTIFLHTTLQALGSRALNYGLLWGLSEKLLSEINRKTLKTNNKEMASLLTQSPYLLDLEAPLFFSNHSDEDTIENAKKVAVSFVKWLYDSGFDTKRLIESNLLATNEKVSGKAFEDFNSLFTDLKNQYLKSLGLSLRVEPKEYYLRYMPHSSMFPLLIETDWGTWYFKKDYKNPYVGDEYAYLEELSVELSDLSYPSLENLIERMSATVSNILEAFDYTLEDLQPKYNYVLNEIVYYRYNLGGYVGEDHYVLHANLMHFAHEFTHVIEDVSGFYADYFYDYPWLAEGLANYVGYTYSPEYREMAYATLKMETEDENSVVDGKSFNDIYQQSRDAVDDDIRAWEDALAYWSVKEGYYSKTDNNTTYYFRHTSFVYYLVEKFGWENAAKVFLDPTLFTSIFGQTQEELWREWGEDLFARYGDVAPENFLGKVGI